MSIALSPDNDFRAVGACNVRMLHIAFLAVIDALPEGMALKVLSPSRQSRIVLYRDAAIFYCYQRGGGYGAMTVLGELFKRDHSSRELCCK